jgi:hypothetical protein
VNDPLNSSPADPQFDYTHSHRSIPEPKAAVEPGSAQDFIQSFYPGCLTKPRAEMTLLDEIAFRFYLGGPAALTSENIQSLLFRIHMHEQNEQREKELKAEAEAAGEHKVTLSVRHVEKTLQAAGKIQEMENNYAEFNLADAWSNYVEVTGICHLLLDAYLAMEERYELEREKQKKEPPGQAGPQNG